jgi:hypothetical protein
MMEVSGGQSGMVVRGGRVVSERMSGVNEWR